MSFKTKVLVVQADLILMVATEDGSPVVTTAEQDTVRHLLNPPASSVEAHPVRLSQSGHRTSTSAYSNSKMSSMELAGCSEIVHGACFTADSDDVRCLCYYCTCICMCIVISQVYLSVDASCSVPSIIPCLFE